MYVVISAAVEDHIPHGRGLHGRGPHVEDHIPHGTEFGDVCQDVTNSELQKLAQELYAHALNTSVNTGFSTQFSQTRWRTEYSLAVVMNKLEVKGFKFMSSNTITTGSGPTSESSPGTIAQNRLIVIMHKPLLQE